MKTGTLTFRKLGEKKDRTEEEKKLLDLSLVWFGLDTNYLDYPLSGGSRYGVAQFTLNQSGLLEPFLAEFNLKESDINVWKWDRTYNKEVSTCFLFTTKDHRSKFFGTKLISITIENFYREHYNAQKQMVFTTKKRSDGHYDTFSFAFEQPVGGNVWRINPFTATLKIGVHLPNNYTCKKGTNCCEINPNKSTRDEWNKAKDEWSRQASDLSDDDKNKLRELRYEIGMFNLDDEKLPSKKQFKKEVTPALFERICNSWHNSRKCTIKRKPHGQQAISVEVLQSEVTFTAFFYCGKITLSGGLRTGKDSLMNAIRDVNPETILNTAAVRKPLGDITNKLSAAAGNKLVPTKPAAIPQIKRPNVAGTNVNM